MSSILYNQIEADLYRESVKGPCRCLLNNIKQVLMFRDGILFSDRKFDDPLQSTDNLLFYNHCVKALQYYQNRNLILKVDRDASIQRLITYRGAQKILSSSDAIMCWDYLIIFDVLLRARSDIGTIQLDIAWAYEVVSRAYPSDAKLARTLSRSQDFEVMSDSELWDDN